jgi:drug/metabolite transporter (DMT)-like permease
MLLLALAATWGGSYALTAVLLDHGMPWAWIAALRLLVGAAVIAGLARLRTGRDGPRTPAWRSAVVGALAAGVSLPMIALGQRWVASGLAGVIVAAAPLCTAALERAGGGARLGRGGVAGLLTGFAGVVLLFAADLSGSSDALLGGLVILLAPLGYGAGAVLSRRWTAGVPPLRQTADNLAWAAAWATTIALVATAAGEGAPALHGAGAWLPLLVLGVLGTGLGFAAFFALVATVGPARTMLVTYVAPVFALAYGAAFLHEAVTVAAAAGVVLVVAGTIVAARPVA